MNYCNMYIILGFTNYIGTYAIFFRLKQRTQSVNIGEYTDNPFRKNLCVYYFSITIVVNLYWILIAVLLCLVVENSLYRDSQIQLSTEIMVPKYVDGS